MTSDWPFVIQNVDLLMKSCFGLVDSIVTISAQPFFSTLVLFRMCLSSRMILILALGSLLILVGANHVPLQSQDDSTSITSATSTTLRLATFVSSNMVLQREPHAARVWGWAEPGSNISVALNEGDLLAFDIVNADGTWSVEMPPQPAGAGHTLQVTDGTTMISLDDVAFGDVYLCSGQSNMEYTVNLSFHADQTIAESIQYPNLRLATVNKTVADNPMDNVGSKTPTYIWSKSSPEALNQVSIDGGKWGVYSATCYYFGLELYKALDSKVPIGLVTSSWGGQRVETFSSAEALADTTCGGLNPSSYSRPSEVLVDELVDETDDEELEIHPDDMQIWNAMIHPLLPMRFVGVVWYQGESNASNVLSYACRFPAMIADWRRNFGDLSFVYVELAALRKDYRAKVFPFLRAAQGAALQLPKVGKATAIDLGDPESPDGPIHSRRKQEVGRRIALTMRALHYQDAEAQQSYTGPVFEGAGLHIDPTHSTALLRFQPGTARGLHLNGTAACTPCCNESPFEVLTSERQWIRATWMQIRNNEQVFLTTNVSSIYGIRYAWEGRPECALYNGQGGPEDHSGIPTAPFQWCAFSSGKPNWLYDACDIPLNTLDDEEVEVESNQDSLGTTKRQTLDSSPNELRLPTFVDSHMVLQRAPQKARVWGWAAPGANVTATLLKFDLSVHVTTDQDGAWFLDFPPQLASDGHSVEITDGTKTILLEDIAFGDVFFCSGQSNMEMTIGAVYDSQKEVADAINYPNIRLATVAKTTSDVPMDDVKSPTYYTWARSSPQSATGNQSDTHWDAVFSATCYFFGRELSKSMNGTLPIGLVVSSWGGQKIETFSSMDALADRTCGGTRPATDDLKNRNAFPFPKGMPTNEYLVLPDPVSSTQLWNAMIHPLLPMRFTAALWYQGEANSNDPTSYACRFPAMITDWRAKFNLPSLEFVYVQLAAFASASTWPRMRAAQSAALQLPGVGMATTIDLGETSDAPHGGIHPRRKQEVGRRLALVMRALHYRDPYAQYHFTGPVFEGVGITSSPIHSSIRLSFQPGTADLLHLAGAATCTTCCQEPPFLVLEGTGTWSRVAKAQVSNIDEIVLFTTASQVLGIRYAWEAQPECLLYNGAGGPDDHGGLPAAPWEWCAYPSGRPKWTNSSCLIPDFMQ